MSSDHHPGAFETYRETFADLYDVQEVAHRGLKNFRSSTRGVRFGSSVLARARSVGQTFIRDAARIRKSGLEHVSVVVNLAEGRGDFDGHSVRAEAGSVQFRDLSRPSGSRTDSIDLINLIVARHMVPASLLNRSLHGRSLPANSPGGRLVASHLKTLAEVGPELTEEEGISAVEATFVIAERFLGGPGIPTHHQGEAILRTVRRRAMHIFDTLPNASIDDVAREIGVSRSSLYRAFADMGGVMTYVRNRRLDRAYAMLRSGAGGHSTAIEAAARASGFLSRTRFKSAFRARFGFDAGEIAPSSLTRADAMGRASGLVDSAAHDVFIDWLRVGEVA